MNLTDWIVASWDYQGEAGKRVVTFLPFADQCTVTASLLQKWTPGSELIQNVSLRLTFTGIAVSTFGGSPR